MPEVQVECPCGGSGRKRCPECKGGGIIWVEGEECIYCADGVPEDKVKRCEHCDEGPLCPECYAERDCCPDAVVDIVITEELLNSID
jgi:hypothetical protein